MSFQFAFIFETIVAVLLTITIGYSIALERRLRGLRLGEDVLRKTIQELHVATERAGRAVGALKLAIGECESELATQVRVSDKRAEELKRQIAIGQELLSRITRIVGLGEPRAAA